MKNFSFLILMLFSLSAGVHKYVDLSQPQDTGSFWPDNPPVYIHTGESDDPFNYAGFFFYTYYIGSGLYPYGSYYSSGSWHAVDSRNDTLYIKGSIAGYNLILSPGNGQVFLPWSPLVNGPYALHFTGGTDPLYGIWSGGIIWSNAAKALPSGCRIYSCFLLSGATDQYSDGTWQVNDNTILKGCTIKCNEVWVRPSTGLPPAFYDCILLNPEKTGENGPVPLILKNCALRGTRNSYIQQTVNPLDTNCQFDFNPSNDSIPAWNASYLRYLFGDTGNGMSLSTPPKPGNSPYTGYALDLFGNPRKNIGANFQGIVFDSLSPLRSFHQYDTIRTKLMRIKSPDSAVFSKPVIVRDSAVFASGCKPRAITGSYIKSNPHIPLIVKVNGIITGVPRVYADTGSRIKWK
jgi:hypothetical protein